MFHVRKLTSLFRRRDLFFQRLRSSSEIIVTVEQGKLKGTCDADIDGVPFFSFMGIPYATAPAGKLRFKPPQPVQKWKGVLDATKDGDCCVSFQMVVTGKGIGLELGGCEDCLVLNVFTHQLFQSDKDKLKPVMVFVHGGAFITGSSRRILYGPEFLMTEDIVLVTINYRVACLGFLVIEDPSLGVTGNAGLKDQLEALKWVQRNIDQFGGDPCNVTLFGNSAGAASVHYLMLSPHSKGLFHKVILQSGTTLCPWTRGINDAKDLVQKLGCNETNNEKLLTLLQEVSAQELLIAEQKMPQHGLSPSFKRPLGPTVEAKTPEALLIQEPLDILKSGTYNHVPMILGYCSIECVLAFMDDQIFITEFEDLVPYYYGIPKGSTQHKDLNTKIAQFYFKKNSPDKNDRLNFTNYFSDAVFINGVYQSLQLHRKFSQKPIYYYRVSLDTDYNLFKKMVKVDFKGAAHGDCMSYLFKIQARGLKKGTIEEKCVRRFVKMWANFARCGSPVPEKNSLLDCEWRPVGKDCLNYLEIDTELKDGVDPDIERMKFWDEINKSFAICMNLTPE